MQDRRLDQDDNRGLGRGIRDNVPILNIFKLGLENMSSCSKRSGNYPGGFLTSTMHAEMNRLLHPMEKLIWHDDNNDWIGVQPQFGGNRWPLDAGIEIAVLRNLKQIPTDFGKESTMGLVINRAHLEQCDGDDEATEVVSINSIFVAFVISYILFISIQINIHKILAIKQNADIFNASITLLQKKARIDTSSVSICPMEIKAFIINR